MEVDIAQRLPAKQKSRLVKKRKESPISGKQRGGVGRLDAATMKMGGVNPRSQGKKAHDLHVGIGDERHGEMAKAPMSVMGRGEKGKVTQADEFLLAGRVTRLHLVRQGERESIKVSTRI